MGRRCCNISPLHRLHKKQVISHRGIKLHFVTYNNIRLKCYLNFVLMAPCVTVGSPILARAIAIFNRVSNQIKKNYLFLATYSEINSITISLIVLCCLAAIIFKSVFNSSSIDMCNFVSVIFLYLLFSMLFSCYNICFIMYL